MNFDEHEIPHYMRDGLTRWVNDHIPPGGFLQAVLVNDLARAVGKADSTNERLLSQYVRFLYNEVPDKCHGSPQRVFDWCHPDYRDDLEFKC